MQVVNNTLIQAIEFQQQGKIDEASSLFSKVLAIDPGNAAALYSLSLIAHHSGNNAEALRISERGVNVAPLFSPLHLIHGAVLQAMGRKEEALQSYDKALEISPNYVEVLTNSGVLLRDMLRHREALERFNHILSFDSFNTSALSNCGILLTEFKQSELAIPMFKQLISINPDYDYALGLLAYEQLHICDWTDFEALSKQITEGLASGRRSCKSLAFMSFSDSAEDHQRAAKLFSEQYCPKRDISYWQGERYHHKKIRLAYVSPDLREHPVGHLMAGVFERHDKSRFELTAISLGIDDGSRLRARMLKTFDHFIDAQQMSASQIAQTLREMEIDIAVDLAGYTSDSRADIFAHRPVPVQVNYLGYPGTMGTEYMDYILADRHVIPENQQQFYSEKVVYLPDSYLPTDSGIQIAERTPSREECGLPATGVVFCSFSHDYKILPATFAIWMRLLQQVPGSVLWLMSRRDISIHNLCLAAEQQGIDPARLIFATRVPLVEDHLARYRLADIFLDTHPYNAHTTAADALMAGLPVVTYMGNAFPARVAGSLLQAIGMPELIARSLEEYEQIALRLVTTPELLADVKARLVANKATCALFDTEGFTRNLEEAYIGMHSSVEHSQAQLGDKFSPLTGPETINTDFNGKIMTKSLDLGCGMRPNNPFNADEVFGIDVRDDIPANIRSADLAIEPIPFDDNSFDFVTAHDFLEHIPRVLYAPMRRNAFIELMNEIYRVLKVGGLFLSNTPAYPQSAAFQDPTHVNIIIAETFPFYFDDVNRWASGYGFNGAFKITFQEWRGAHLLTVMKKVLLPEAENLLLNTTSENNNMAQALELQRQGKTDEAIKLFWEEHKSYPRYGDPLYSLSQIALNNKNYAEALRISEHGVMVSPLYTHLWLTHGMALQALERKEEALQSYNKALEINPNYIDVLIKSAMLLKDMSRYSEALERFKHILTVDSANTFALENCSILNEMPDVLVQ